jgi:hypothetical protein
MFPFLITSQNYANHVHVTIAVFLVPGTTTWSGEGDLWHFEQSHTERQVYWVELPLRIRGFRFQALAYTSYVMNEIFRIFPQYLQANDGI